MTNAGLEAAVYVNFNPRPPRGGRHLWETGVAQMKAISIHAPREGGDGNEVHRRGDPEDFNPRPPRGGRLMGILISSQPFGVFQSTPPARGATMVACGMLPHVRISIHAPREGGDCHPYSSYERGTNISIHAPREGGDSRDLCGPERLLYFNPRPPRGGRLEATELVSQTDTFQSTPPARGATSGCT